MKFGAWLAGRQKWFTDSVARNPAFWVMFGLFLLAEWGNYNSGQDLRKICELTGEHIASYGIPQDTREIVDAICNQHANAENDYEDNP